MVTPLSDASTRVDEALTFGMRFWLTAVDDSHADTGIGKGWVVVYADALTEADIIANLKAGNFYASTGADVAVSVSGLVITAGTSSAGTIDFIGQGGATLQTTASATSATYTGNGSEKYVRVKITKDADATLAWSNPVWVDLMTGGGGVIRKGLPTWINRLRDTFFPNSRCSMPPCTRWPGRLP